MFKKRDKKANLRRVQDEDEDDNKEDTGESGFSVQAPGQMNIQKKKRKAAPDAGKKSTVLSFGGGEEDGGEEEFQIKRSAHSRNAIQQFKSKSSRKSSGTGTYTQVSAAGSYSKEALKELRSQSSSAATSRSVETSGGVTQAETTDEERRDNALACAVSSAIKRTEHGAIPSAELIHLARKKREKVRKEGDFLPLDDTVSVNGNKSRMVREDENDRSDGEDGLEYLNFSDVSRKVTKRQHRTEMEAAMMECSMQEDDKVLGNARVKHGDEDEDDDDAAIRRWEEQQMTSAASGRLLGTAATVLEQQNMFEGQASNAYGPARYGKKYLSELGMAAKEAVHPSAAMPVMSASQLPPILGTVSAVSVLSSLASNHKELEQMVVSHEGQLSRATEELHLSEKSEESMERQIMDASERYDFFQETGRYVRDLLTCLAEKVNTLELLEDRMNGVMQDQSKLISARRKQDLADEAQENAEKDKTMMSFGSAHQTRVTEREGRRMRRRMFRKARGLLAYDEGLSSDDEPTEMDKVKFSNEKESVIVEAGKLFEDVDEHFKSLKLIGQRFEMWKLAYRSSYDDAYISLCLTKLFAPFVRLAVLAWNPLEAGQAMVEDMSWCKELLLFSAPSSPDSQPDLEDEDTFLIPNLVEKVIVTKVRDIVRHVWDPCSSTQTSSLVAVIRTLISDFPSLHAGSKSTEELLQAVFDKLRMSVDVEPYIPLYTKAVMENPSSKSLQFFHRQYWSCFKLLVNVLQWQGVLSKGRLQQLCLDGLLNRYLLRSIQHLSQPYDCVDKCAKIVDLLPESWFEGKKKHACLDGLSMLMSSKLPTMLYHATLGAPSTERTRARNTCLTLERLLGHIGRAKEAIGLVSQFS